MKAYALILTSLVLATTVQAQSEQLPYPPHGGGSSGPSWTNSNGNLYANPTGTKIAIGSNTFRGKLNINAGETDWITLSRNADSAYWRIRNLEAAEELAFSFTDTAGATTWNILSMSSSGKVGLMSDLDTADGRLNLGRGHGDWLNLTRTSDAGFWRIHNPAEQDRLEFGYQDDQGTNHWKLLCLLNNGNVGIGTHEAHERLTVDGKILAEEVRVLLSTEWPDYVFDDEYDLPNLDEVSSFIDENGHLPGVPTADEIGSSGVLVGEMNATLLRKVEELTLYVIELHEANRTLRERFAVE